MGKVINIPSNLIGKDDREKLESFGGHTIAHGRATRWHWKVDGEGNRLFQIYSGGEDEVMAVQVSRDRELNAFCAHDCSGELIASGSLERVFTELERYFVYRHDELPDGYS